MSQDLDPAEVQGFREAVGEGLNAMLDDAAAAGELGDPAELERLASVLSAGLRDEGPPPELAEALALELKERGDVAAASMLATMAMLVPDFRARAERALALLAERGVAPRPPAGTGELRAARARRFATPTGEMHLVLIERPGSELAQVAIVAIRAGDDEANAPWPLRECLLTPWGERDAALALLRAPDEEPGAARGEEVSPEVVAGAIDRALAAHRERDIPIRWDPGLALPLLGLALRGDGAAFGGVPILAEGYELFVDPEDPEAFERMCDAILGDFTDWLGERRSEDPDLIAAAPDIARAMLRWQSSFEGTLAHWTVDDIEEFLLHEAPRSLPADEETVANVAEGVSAFITFLSGSELLGGDRLHELIAECEDLRTTAGERARDRSLWGPAKTMIEQMRSEGVELGDQEALDAWLEDFNSRDVAERDMILGPSLDRRLLQSVVGPDARLPRGVDASALPSRGGPVALGIAWFPAGEYEAARERWEDVAETWGEIDYHEYAMRLEATMRGWSTRGARPRPVRLSLDSYELWCSARDVDPAEARAAYAADQIRAGNATGWPPGRNDPCWCGSERKYKRCCGSITASALDPFEVEV